MGRDGTKIAGVVEENRDLLKVEEGSPHWDRYLLYLDHIITRGLVDTVNCRYAVYRRSYCVVDKLEDYCMKPSNFSTKQILY